MKRIIALMFLAAAAGACGGEQRTVTERQGSPQREGPQEIAVTAIDYAFEGVPDSVPAGETTFVMRNDGHEPHVMFFARIEGTTKGIAELMRLSEKESERFVEEVGGIQKPVAPMESGDATLELEPGRYAYVCFVSAPDGNAHYEKGMFGELEVTA